VAQIAADFLADIIDAARALNPGDGLSPRVLRAIAAHAGPDIRRSAETGAGGSTLLFSHLSARHTAFTVQGDNSIIARIKSSLLFRAETADFIEGPTQRTLPLYAFDQPLDAVLIDGPHGFPFPQLEYFYLYPHLAVGALLIVDDIHIRTVHEFYRFLREDAMFELIDVVERTAFFQRTSVPVFDPWDDGWWQQSYNRRPLSRYTWREELQKSLPHPLRSILREIRAVLRGGIVTGIRRCIRIEAPGNGSTVADQTLIWGRAELPPHASLWIFAHRADLGGWWPQGGGPAVVTGDQWEQTCKFGEADDAGHAFDIAVLALDEQKHRAVLRWFVESARSGRCDPMPLPEPMPGTPIALIRVVRADRTDQ
jgi:hypothetical protein